MIQVIYRWHVPADNRDAFIAAWAGATQQIRATIKGARGSFCIVGVDDPTEVITIARWDELDQWQEFVKTAKSATMTEMHRLATPLSHAALNKSVISRSEKQVGLSSWFCLWPKADIPKNAIDVAIGGKADIPSCTAHVRL